MKFQNDFYTIGEDGEAYLLDRKGNVLTKTARRKPKLVYGAGVNDWKFAIGSTEGGHAFVYDDWKGILGRAYDEKWKERYPTYEGVSVAKEWETFSVFFHDVKEYLKQGWQLDKDLLFFGNKQYNKNTCIFVPPWLNSLLLDHSSARGESPQGVDWHTRSCKYRARCNVDGKNKHLGLFSNVKDASAAYADFKIDYIKSKRLDIEAIGLHNDLHLRFGKDFSLTDRVIETFRKQVMIF